MVILTVLAGWTVLSLLALVVVAAVCRVGHGEDLRRGYVDLAETPARPTVPVPRLAVDAQAAAVLPL